MENMHTTAFLGENDQYKADFCERQNRVAKTPGILERQVIVSLGYKQE